MKILLISVTLLLALSSTVSAGRYNGHNEAKNKHHSERYVFSYGKYPAIPFKYRKSRHHNSNHHRPYYRPHYTHHVSHHNNYNDNLPIIILGAGVIGYMLGDR